MKYIVDFGNGIYEAASNLEAAKKLADESAAYTQHNIIIKYGDKEVAARRWYGCLSDIELSRNPIRFGSLGFYDDWI